ncbi:TetR family transcriptional regulator [Nocardioides sp. CER19]|uniref:TetR/AcrR family transcriptional regulator n=1 Tax=Nocardioides sp. CER19 TaxID=3038538 RepID=UPI00244A34D6|nr:TetR family transcriptional regulator [Nocardioides sp. CER19]MDH2416131.1 TetR family transcriptional regulator [Nocardioides sp. CER19]
MASETARGYRKGAETRLRIEEAAAAAFATRGFHGTSTRDIAAAAGMSPAAVYIHHGSKENLLFVLSRDGHRHILELVQDAARSREGAQAQLEEVARAFAEDHARHHVRARLVNYELLALEPAHLDEILGLREAIARELVTIVERGVADGVFATSDTHMAANAVMSLGIDVARWYRDGSSWTPERVGAFYADMALRMLGARRPPATPA